jgi:hypothetical protein
MARMVRSGQFTLKSLFIATVFFAAACAAARHVTTVNANGSRAIAFASIPVALCGAFGILVGRLGRWLVYGVGISIAIILLIVVALVLPQPS